MDILSYLSTLIKTHKEVGIPGLGTIYKKKSPGRYDINTHSFLPPSYSLCFTSDLKEQSLLSELISKNRDISVDAATFFIEQFSQNILDELSSHQESDFGDLGTFSTISGSLSFIPKQDTNLGFDFYGLPQLKSEPNTDQVKVIEEPVQKEAPPVKIEEQQETQKEQSAEDPQIRKEQLELENNNADLRDGTEEVEKESDDQPVFEEISEVEHIVAIPEVKPTPVIETPIPAGQSPTPVVEGADKVVEPIVPPIIAKKQEEVHFSLDYTGATTPTEKAGIPAYLKVIIALVILAVLAAITYLVKPDLFDGIVEKPIAQQPVVIPDSTQILENIERAKIDSIAHADSLRISNEKAILAADSARDSIAAIKPIATPTLVEPEVTYEILAASLINQSEAEKFLADMKARGISAKIANMPGRRVKITLGTFTDRESARKELEVLKKTTKLPGIYIKEVRHTNNSK